MTNQICAIYTLVLTKTSGTLQSVFGYTSQFMSEYLLGWLK